MIRGQGVGLIDPHGDLADTLLRLVPKHRTNDVVLFDAADREYAVAFNPLACSDPHRIDQVTSGAVAALKKLNDSWGPRLENLLRNAVFAVVEQQGTLVTLLRLLTDAAFRERFVPGIRDDVVRAFWQHEFAGWSKPYRTEAVAAITNKVQPFLTNTSVRAIVSQTGRSLDLRRVMDEGKILIVNLSKGKVGEDNAALLGSFLVTALQQAAMTRADVPEEDRRDFYLYIDEFQNFVTTSFETILSEARKYRLNLTVSHQYLAQLNEATAAAIAGNIGTIIAFAVGSEDADWLARAMTVTPGQLLPQDLTNLPRYTAYARLLLDGVSSAPFSMITLPPPTMTEDRTEFVLQSSRRQFSRPLDIVRQQLARDLTMLSAAEQRLVAREL
jgi:type IV secretory pathway TraG/TraD family ATPase VirD4